MALILIVDDQPARRLPLTTMLTQRGHRAIEVSNGVDALAAARAEHPDLIIADVVLPPMDGCELARRLRLDPITSAIPVVFSSPHQGAREAWRRALLHGVSAVLATPADATTVLTTVERVLARAPRGREAPPPSDIADEPLGPTSAQSALRHETDRAQRYLDAANVILLGLDLDGRITLINRKGCDLLGRREDELLGRDWIETCLPVRMRGTVRTRLRELVGGDLSVVENPILTSAGAERVIEWHNTRLRDDAGVVIGTLSSGTDVTERKQALDALRTTEERMRFALDSANVGIWDMDPRAGTLRWSETLERQYGLAPGAFGGTFAQFAALIHPDDRAAVLARIAAATATGSDFAIQHRALLHDGTTRWLSGAGRVFVDEHGVPVRALGISQDVTEREHADHTRARLAAIIDSSNDAIVSMALDGTIVTWNHGAERLYGYIADDVVGRNRTLLVPPDRRDELAARIARAARGEAGEAFETQRIRKDGTTVDVSLTISPMTDSAGRVTGVSTIAQDITHRKHAEAEVRRLNDEIQRQRLRVFHATMRTVQDIVNNLLNGFQLVRIEGEEHLPPELLTLVDGAIEDAAAKLKSLGDLETVSEKQMAIGVGIEYPGAGS